MTPGQGHGAVSVGHQPKDAVICRFSCELLLSRQHLREPQGPSASSTQGRTLLTSGGSEESLCLQETDGHVNV